MILAPNTFRLRTATITLVSIVLSQFGLSAQPELPSLSDESKTTIEGVLSNPLIDVTWDTYYELEMKYADFDTSGFLISIANDARKLSRVRQGAVGWLSISHKPGARLYVVTFYDKLVSEDVKAWDHDELELLTATLISLGASNSETATERLLDILRPEPWLRREYVAESRFSKEELIAYIRRNALMGLALSGTKKARQARKNGRHLPAEFKHTLETWKDASENWERWKERHPALQLQVIVAESQPPRNKRPPRGK